MRTPVSYTHLDVYKRQVHENFQRFMTDLEIYVDGYVSANIQNLNAGLEATRQMLKKKYAADENDLYMSTLKLGQIDEDEYFGRVLYDELVDILKLSLIHI